MNLGFSIGTRESMRSFAGGGGLGGVRDVLKPQVARRINGNRHCSLVLWFWKKKKVIYGLLSSSQKYSERYLTVFGMKKN